MSITLKQNEENIFFTHPGLIQQGTGLAADSVPSQF